MNKDRSSENSSDPNAETEESLQETPNPRIPKEIDHFKIRRVIGTGGMGIVYEAVQDSPKRKVALKVMRSGVASPSALRRFEYESQVLGKLNHPCIAQVYDAGKWDDGTGAVPYFAMEYIVGAKTLLNHANQKGLQYNERLELIEQICDAVHHGHLKGVIHRDLKPDNILIDSQGNPKIIDFGIAKATDSDMAVTTMQTNVGQLVGTVQYMSPEQCEADPDLIDARSDVYAIGVILYELLTGHTPYNLGSIPIYEAARVIREQQPTKMTTIDGGITGDVETIVSKAMEKDRDRRYQSVHELQEDIKLYLANEPIHARRASIGYQLKMFGKRNRAVVGTVLSIFAVLTIATVFSTYKSIEASNAKDEAIVDRDRAMIAEKKLEDQNSSLESLLEKVREAQSQTREAFNEVVSSLISVQSLGEFSHDLLALGAPRNAQGESLTLHDILLFAMDEITVRFGHEPQLEAGVRASIGTLLWEMGDLKNSRIELQRCLELFNSFDPNKRGIKVQFEAGIVYAKVLRDLGQYEDARDVVDPILQSSVDMYGNLSPITLDTKAVLADIMQNTLTGDPLLVRREILDAIEEGADVTREFEIESRGDLAGSLLYQHGLSGSPVPTPELLESEEVLAEVLKIAKEELGELHPVTNKCKIWQASIFHHLDRYNEALELSLEVLDNAQLVFGAEHTKTAEAYAAVGFFRFMRGRNAESAEMLSKAITIYDKIAGEQSINALMAQTWLANALSGLDQANQAELILLGTLPILEEKMGSGHTSVINAKATLGKVLMSQGKFDKGEPLLDEVTDYLRALPSGNDSEPVLNMRFLKAIAYVTHGRTGVDELVDAYIPDVARVYGLDNIMKTMGTVYYLSQLYIQSGRVAHGFALLEHWLGQAREASGQENATLIEIELELADGFLDHDMTEEAERILDRLSSPVNELFEELDQVTIAMKVLQARVMVNQGNDKKATSMLLALRDQLETTLGAEDELTVKVEIFYAKALLGEERWDELDVLMTNRFERRYDNPDLLLEMADVIINNQSEDYKQRYLDLALELAQRVISIRGEDNPDASYVLANVYLSLGEHDEALNWLAKAIAYADEDHEDIDKYREELAAVTAGANEDKESMDALE